MIEHERIARDKLFFGKVIQSYEGQYTVDDTIYEKNETPELVQALKDYRLKRIAEIKTAKSMPKKMMSTKDTLLSKAIKSIRRVNPWGEEQSYQLGLAYRKITDWPKKEDLKVMMDFSSF